MFIDDFIKHIIKFNNINNLINSIKDFVYVRLWVICVIQMHIKIIIIQF